MAQLGIVSGTGIPSKLTKFFTGSPAYHTIWLEGDYIYDMNFIRRRRPANHYDNKSSVTVLYLSFANVTKEYLEEKLTNDNSVYGAIDYLLFALRPFYHLIGKSTVNANGVICSEMINNDLWACGYKSPFNPADMPPSPADLERWLKDGS